MYRVDLYVRPKHGVRDPQGNAVEEALRDLGYSKTHVDHVGRTLRMNFDVVSEKEANDMAHDMCKRLLVNPNLETYEVIVTKQP